MFELKTLAAFLDFGACANAAFDHKSGCQQERLATLRLLEQVEIGLPVQDYLQRLGHLERRRPMPGGDRSQFQKVRLYREAVIRLSLGMAAIIAGDSQNLDEAIDATSEKGDLNVLFRIVMLCQIIDDVLDYSQDRAAELPSFLTACLPLSQAFELTQRVAYSYADAHSRTRTTNCFPLRTALFLVSLCTKLAVSLRSRWAR